MTMKFGFGQPLTRKEDDPLLRGAGRYIADVSPAKPLQAVVIRSPHAHARFRIGDLARVRSYAWRTPGADCCRYFHLGTATDARSSAGRGYKDS